MTDTASKTTTISNEELLVKLRQLLGTVPEPMLTKENTAIVVIDVQYFDASKEAGLGLRARELGDMEFLEWYFDRVQNVMVPNIQRILATARRKGVEIVHVRVASNTNDGRDCSLRFKSWGAQTPPDSKEAQILPEVWPEGDELVISKTTESVFNSTNIDRLLRNMGIANVIVVGVVTNGCVEGAVRGAAERDYGTILVEDAAAALAPQLHEMAIVSMGHKDASIKSTDEVIKALEAL
jgi:nicotinamidase-related amidase